MSFKGKAIYNPSGKAGEYSYWACNFYIGCSNGCSYCYCKKGRGAKVLGGDVPVLKKCFKDRNDAIRVFQKELLQNFAEIKKHGLFFSFTTDPLISETWELTFEAINFCINQDIPVKILTKSIYWINKIVAFDITFLQYIEQKKWKENLIIGFSLTGIDELEPNASTNNERLTLMYELNKMGFKTFASIEPIIDLRKSLEVIRLAFVSGCKLFKIGLLSGGSYSKKDLQEFFDQVNTEFHYVDENNQNTTPFIYWKDSVLTKLNINRDTLKGNCVNRDFNLFTYDK